MPRIESFLIPLFILLASVGFSQDITVSGPAGCNGAPQAGVFPVPCGVTNVTVELYGGGGGAGGGGGGSNGGFYDTRGGGGGGGGAYVSFTANVTPGSIFTYSIGAGGCGGDNGSDFNDGDDGSSGGATSVSGTDALGNPVNLSAGGGAAGGGGDGSEGPPGSGGAGGTAIGGTTNTNGTAGSNGNGGNGGTGGNGSGPAGGNGGATNGGNGTSYGGGGGGGNDSDGGDGAPGAILITFNTTSLPPGPTITSGAPTCTLDGTSTIDNYDPTETYTFDPPGPTAGAGGLISGMVTGTSYVVISGDITCPSDPSLPFSNAAATGTLNAPTISSVAATCQAAGTSTISNYNSALTYTFDPLGPTVGAGGVINGMTVGTSYTVIASEGVNCVSPPSQAFGNDAQLPGPTLTITGALSYCVGGNTTITASGGVSYSWTTGDNTASVTVTQGTYTVTVTDGSGCISTEDVTVTESSTPVADFMVVDACAGDPVQFTDATTIASGSLTDWSWDFGDGNSSTLQNPTHIYAAPGTYDVTLTASSGSCSDMVTLQATSFPLPVADFTAANVCVGTAVDFTDNSNANGSNVLQWGWDFGDGGTDLTQSPSHLYANAGTYDVTLAIVTSDLCVATTTEQVIVFPAPVAAFSATTVCEGSATVFQNLSTVTSGSISGQAWDFGDNLGTSLNGGPNYTYANAGTYSVLLGVTSSNGCIATTTQNVTVNPLPSITATSTNVLCAGQTNGTASASASGGSTPYSYQWNNFLQSTTANIQNLPPGSYTVTVTDGQGCAADTTVTVIQPLPTLVNVVAFDDTCGLGNGAAQAIMLGGSGPFEYVWSSIHDSLSIYSEDITPSGWNTNLGPGTYSVVVTDAGGCTANGSVAVEQIPAPMAAFTTRSKPEEFLDPSVQFINQSTGAESYEWHFGDDDVSYNEDPVHDYETGGVFLVMLIAHNDPAYGCTDTAFQYIEVDPLFTFYVPNAFTPDDDTKNDTWGPKGDNFEYESYNVKVFDRWGKLVWQTDNHEVGWDGLDMESLKPVKQGMYVYQFVIKKFNTFKPKVINGTVMLYRHH